LKKSDTSIPPGYQICHNYVWSHEGLDSKTPAETAGIRVEGENNWLTIIQNAATHHPTKLDNHQNKGEPTTTTEPGLAKFMLNATCMSISASELFGLGKVRIDTVKRVSRELIRRFPDRFTGQFESDKQAVNELVITQSKRLRNRIAGYVTRLKVVEAERAASTQVSEEEPEPEEPGMDE
jgi:small subunit ribosomal protein S17e